MVLFELLLVLPVELNLPGVVVVDDVGSVIELEGEREVLEIGEVDEELVHLLGDLAIDQLVVFVDSLDRSRDNFFEFFDIIRRNLLGAADLVDVGEVVDNLLFLLHLVLFGHLLFKLVILFIIYFIFPFYLKLIVPSCYLSYII